MKAATKFVTFGITSDDKLLSALGTVTIRHGQLDHVLRMTIKTIAGLSIKEALEETSREGSAKLRNRIEKVAKKKFGEGEVLLKLHALLTRAQRLTEKRNKMIHGFWGQKLDGTPVVRKEDHSWETAPSSAEVSSLSNEIEKVTKELNFARLKGFIFEAVETEPDPNTTTLSHC